MDKPLDRSQIIENAISSLANTMRIYGEAHMRFGDLFKIDPEEAIGISIALLECC